MKLPSNKVFYAVITIDQFIICLCNSSKIIHIKIYHNQIITFRKINNSLILCKTSHIYRGGQYAYKMKYLDKT